MDAGKYTQQVLVQHINKHVIENVTKYLFLNIMHKKLAVNIFPSVQNIFYFLIVYKIMNAFILNYKCTCA